MEGDASNKCEEEVEDSDLENYYASLPNNYKLDSDEKQYSDNSSSEEDTSSEEASSKVDTSGNAISFENFNNWEE